MRQILCDYVINMFQSWDNCLWMVLFNKVKTSISTYNNFNWFLFSFDQAMQALSGFAARFADELFEVFVEMRAHLYLHAATLLLKMAQDRQHTWRAVIDLAALCYLLAYQVPKCRSGTDPKPEDDLCKPFTVSFRLDFSTRRGARCNYVHKKETI